MIPADRLELPIAAKVLQPFPFRIEYPMQEGWEFATNVLAADDGTEQRIAVRAATNPRRTLRGLVNAIQPGESAALRALLFGWANRLPVGVPLWWDAMQLSADADEGDESATVGEVRGDIGDRLDGGAEDVPVLLWNRFDDWEPALLTALNAETGLMTFAAPLARDWPEGTVVLPLRLMALAFPVEHEHPSRGTAQVQVDFIEAAVPYGVATASSSDDADAPKRVLMVRGTDGLMSAAMPGVPLERNNADADNIPQSSDPPEEWQLYGYTAGLLFTVQAVSVALLASQKGRVSGVRFCTSKCPQSFRDVIIGLGGGALVGDDATLNIVAGNISGLGVLDPDAPNAFTFEAALSGTGYAPARPPATAHAFVAGAATLTSGPRLANIVGYGSRITSFGVYDAGAPGGIRSETPTDWGVLTPVEYTANATAVVLHHGFCVRCRDVAGYKGVQIVCEEVLRDEEGEETGLFGTPSVETHDFTEDERLLDNGSAEGAIFFSTQVGGNTLFGQAHDGEALQVGGVYLHTLKDELYRVTVSLYDDADVVTEIFKDIFPTMLVEAEVVV